jgi:PAS domain S-box-containing protein
LLSEPIEKKYIKVYMTFIWVTSAEKVFAMHPKFLAGTLARLAFFCLLAICIFTPHASAANQPENIKNVLILFPEESWAAPGYRAIYHAIKSVFDEDPKTRITLFGDSLDLYLFPDEAGQQSIAEFLRKKYANVKIDLLIPVATSGLNFLLRHRNSIFPGIPVVYCGEIANENKRLSHQNDITGTAVNVDLSGTIELARKLHPDLKRIAVVAGTGLVDGYLLSLFRNVFKEYEGKLELIDLAGLPLHEILRRASLLPDSTAILYLTLQRDGEGRIFSNSTTQKLVSQSANVPLYSFVDTALGYGTVGGRMFQMEALGTKTGEIALRVLSGESAALIEPVVISDNPAMFDWRELKRWGISEGNLPPGSIIKYREPTLWSEYKRQVIVGAVLFAVETVFIVALFVSLRNTRRTKEELAASETRYRTVADYTYAWEYWSNPDGTLNYVSPVCEQITGYAPRQFVENPSLFDEIIFPEDRDIWKRHDQGTHADEKPIEYRIVKADGEVRWIEHVCRTVTDEKGIFKGIRASNRDITERRHSEDELQEAYLEIRKLKERLEAESAYLQEEIKTEHNFENIVGMSDALKYVLYRVAQVAATDSTALILGETGTGKELIARAIHSTGKRHGRALIKVNCATLPANLIESELFGHEKGAFTGATAKKLGRFELANQATLFLDEIGELTLDLQSKLLRVIEEGEFERLGSSKTIKVDVRVIAATNRNLEKEMQAGRFREDLWYRLNVFTITVPPLRERPEDIPLLVKHYVDFFNKAFGKSLNKIPTIVIESLQHYHWPGNVRELKHVIERAAINSAGNTMQLAEAFAAPALSPSLTADNSASVSFLSLEEMERQHTLRVLAKVGWKIEGKGGAADILDINPGTLRSRMKKLGIRKPQ